MLLSEVVIYLSFPLQHHQVQISIGVIITTFHRYLKGITVNTKGKRTSDEQFGSIGNHGPSMISKAFDLVRRDLRYYVDDIRLEICGLLGGRAGSILLSFWLRIETRL